MFILISIWACVFVVILISICNHSHAPLNRNTEIAIDNDIHTTPNRNIRIRVYVHDHIGFLRGDFRQEKHEMPEFPQKQTCSCSLRGGVVTKTTHFGK